MRFAIAPLAIGIIVCVGAAKDNVAPQTVDQFFSADEMGRFPGCSRGVIRDGQFIYRKAYGFGSLELKVPLLTQSVFYLGSVRSNLPPLQ